MRTGNARRASPRERLLTTATELFSRHGIRAVGIDRILREASVAKASLYNTYGSKDALVVAYLDEMAERDRGMWADLTEDLADPRARILTLFEMVRHPSDTAPPGSCHLSAALEFPHPATDGEQAVREAVLRQRDWVADMLRTELRTLGLSDPENIDAMADRLEILHDGAVVAARLGTSRDASTSAHGMAEIVLSLVAGAG